MTTYRKSYIGKGQQNANLPIVRVTLNVEDIEPHIYEYDGQKYLTFEIAEMREADKFGRTHTAYVAVKETDQPQPVEEPKAEPAPKKRTRRTKKTA